MNNSFDSLSTIIKNRRSIFPSMYTGERIPDEKIKILLDHANYAPNHRKTEPWRFHIMADQKLVEFSAFVGDWYLNNTPKDKFSTLKHKKVINKPLQSSHIIALCMQRDPEESVPEWEELAALSMAVQNMWLCCTSLEMGCYWSSPKSIMDAHNILSLNTGEKCYGWFYLGMPKANLNLKADLKPIDQKVKWY